MRLQMYPRDIIIYIVFRVSHTSKTTYDVDELRHFLQRPLELHIRGTPKKNEFLHDTIESEMRECERVRE